MSDERELSDYECKILANVAEFGCHVTTVFDPDADDPSFSYSTGFTATVDQGEVIIFGLEHELMGFMVNETMRQCQGGLQLADGLSISGLVEGFDIIARAIPSRNIEIENFNTAMWFHRHRFGTDLDRAFQLVWPGARDGIYPWQDGCDPSVIEMQPALYETGSLH